MSNSRGTIRGLVALGLAVGLVVAACGSSSSSPKAGDGGNGGGGSGSLSSGLLANLDKLTSYQFTWQFSASSSSATAADSGGSLQTSGIVVNSPTKAYKINNLGFIQIIVIGSQGWTSYDNGSTWTVDTTYSADSSSLSELLPSSYYGSDFDTNAGQFTNSGSESKNGVDCIHFSGNTDLGAAGALLGLNANFKADLWVSKDGNYPVSGFYGWSAKSGGDTGSWGYSFDITHVNDAAANAVTAPTNVVALPSY